MKARSACHLFNRFSGARGDGALRFYYLYSADLTYVFFDLGF
jgi:hypothetical protein